mgnify:CR=1 FL=1
MSMKVWDNVDSVVVVVQGGRVVTFVVDFVLVEVNFLVLVLVVVLSVVYLVTIVVVL